MLTFFSAISTQGVERDKLDVIVLKNGDRLTGEIQSLAYGRLEVETDSMGTVQIEWPDGVRIESPQGFMLEDVEGYHLYGSFARASKERELAIATREWATGLADNQSSLEGILGVDWRIFDFATPKTNLTARAVPFPSLTESGRYRTDSSVSLRREIVSDFYLDLSFYHTYDSHPPDELAETSDYGVVTSLGYSF